MRILKKNRMSENFEIDKIKTSVVNSAYDINFILTTADINIITNDVQNRIKYLRGYNGETSTYEVRGAIFHALIDNGFSEVANSYMKIK